MGEYASLYHSTTASVMHGGSAPLLNRGAVRRDLMVELALIVAAVG